jgi:hypothetical protein
MVRLEGLGKLKKKSTSSGHEPVTFRLVAERLNQLCYHVPRFLPYNFQFIIQPSCCLMLHSVDADSIIK